MPRAKPNYFMQISFENPASVVTMHFHADSRQDAILLASKFFIVGVKTVNLWKRAARAPYNESILWSSDQPEGC